MKNAIDVGLLGLGVVGGGTYELLSRKAEQIGQALGAPIRVRRALVRDVDKRREVDVPREFMTTLTDDVLDDPDIDVVIELMGGEEPARTCIETAIRRGKHVVTANKE